jgi:O-antigen/teichoic acid export membrane protein
MTATTRQPRSVLSNMRWSVLGTVFNIAIALVMTPLLISRLGVDQWGLLLLVWSFTGVLGLANFGLGEATMRFVAHYHADDDLTGINRVLGATLTFYVVVCTVISCFVWAAAPVVAQWVKTPETGYEQVETLLRLAAVLFSASTIAGAFHAVTTALRRYDISNGIVMIFGTVRSGGLLLLVLTGLQVLHLVVWEVFVAVASLVVHLLVARWLLPGSRWLPTISLTGMREIFGYSFFSFMTQVFVIIYRESGKLILANRLGTASVAYLGTPDSVANRLHMTVVNAIETLVPRFAASRDEGDAKQLLIASTWAGFACVVVLYVPFAVLMPDFLRLWISPEFARESSDVGRLVTLGLIGSVAFAPIATLLRGTGKPGFVTTVMASAALVVLVGSLLLVPVYGVLGVGLAYFLATLAWLVGLCVCWIYLYGNASWVELARYAGLPLAIACCLGFAQAGLRHWLPEPGWIEFLLLGAAFSGASAVVVITIDLLLGGMSPARLILTRVIGQDRLAVLRERGLGRLL